MKKFLFVFFVLLSAVSIAKPKVYFNFKTFYTPEHTPYVTTLLQFSGGTLKYFSAEGGLQSTIQVTQIFKLKDSIVLADKYILNSPVMKDSVVEDFFDIQNYGLAPGDYDYELVVKDLTSGESISGAQRMLIGPNNKSSLKFSDVEFIQSAVKSDEKNNFVKNGFFLLPYMTNYYPPEMSKIAFYVELYDSDAVLGSDEKFLITYAVSNYTATKDLEGVFQFQRLTSGPIVPVIGYLPINAVPSGDFNLTLNVVDKNNDTLLSKEVFFQRRSDIDNQLLSLDDVEIDGSWMEEIPRDSIPYYLGSIMPISERFEYESIRKMLKGTDTTSMEKYLFAFWKQTAPMNTAVEWYKYKEQVSKAEKLFGTQIKYAFETDRGRTWLKYGAPDQFIDRPNEPSAYPYQIWHYYRIGQRSDIRYVFYNPDLVTNDYPMLHSDMQGELQNYRWQNDLHKRDSPNTNLDNPGGTSQYGGNSNLYYNEINR